VVNTAKTEELIKARPPIEEVVTTNIFTIFFRMREGYKLEKIFTLLPLG